MACEHELKNLVGVADGIVCKVCGKKWATLNEWEAEKKPKKAPRKGAKNASK